MALEIVLNKKKETPQYILFGTKQGQNPIASIYLPKDEYIDSLQIKIQVEVTK